MVYVTFAVFCVTLRLLYIMAFDYGIDLQAGIMGNIKKPDIITISS
ncbi:hypothetical protein [Alkaliphilus pronyensis]|nr:hypothetical protein [Alkaliphilus pronyensis]